MVSFFICMAVFVGLFCADITHNDVHAVLEDYVEATVWSLLVRVWLFCRALLVFVELFCKSLLTCMRQSRTRLRLRCGLFWCI